MSTSRLGQGRRDALLALVAFSASALPFAHELSEAHRYIVCGPAGRVLAPVALNDEAYAVAAKSVMTVAVLALAACVARFSTHGDFTTTLASLPLVRSALVIGALTATGLTAFDVCTAFHGASSDVAGSCHCWLTGVFAAAGALFTIGSACIARAVRDVLRDLCRVIEAFFVWLERTLACTRRQNRIHGDRFVIVELLLATPVGGRAPPVA